MLNILCQVCHKRPATSHLLQVPVGSHAALELHICRSCQAAQGIDVRSDPPDLIQLLPGIAAKAGAGGKVIATKAAAPGEPAPARPQEATCPGCGLGWSGFIEHNKFGCAHCIQAFAEQLARPIEDLHGQAVHVGRLPANAAPATGEDLLNRRLHLEQVLAKAVADEAYERAAAIRDQIRELDEPDS
ncbi:MAG: UvrB/UvrC motif-containing protein [Planctomycetota bacterium]